MRTLILSLVLAAAAAAQNPSTASLAHAGVEALNKGQFTTAVYFLKQVVETEPRHQSAWNDLGRAYLALDQMDAAVDAHLRQIDVNPKWPSAFVNLGQAYLRQGKRDEAMAAFSQQIEVDPQNAAAHASLGSLYYELRRYPEAVTELEKAAEIRPQDTRTQLDLGGAYLGVGETDKGLAILNKMASDAPSAGTWNDVALRLATHKVQLEHAQQYAESAVTTRSVALNNAEADHITIATLRLCVQLANDWDTLGWVHFERGHPDDAARFLNAAWSVNPSDRVGDHLGQFYESRGQKQNPKRPFVASAKTWPVKLLPDKASAEFYVLESPAPATAEARFIRGDDKLRGFAAAIAATVPAGLFPDATRTKLIRRVSVACPGAGDDCAIESLTAAAAVAAELNSVPPDTHIPTGIPAETRPGVFRIGGAVTAPVPIHKVEPQYTEQARKAKYQGTVVLYVEVDPTGRPINIKVLRSLGLGLDEKAMAAVKKWRFKPGTKDGHPVTVAATVEVNFRLL